MSNFVEKCDCDIIRDHPDYEGMAVLMDCDGDEVLIVHESWTDDQIWTVLGILNRYYGKGRKVGMLIKENQIKTALGIKA